MCLVSLRSVHHIAHMRLVTLPMADSSYSTWTKRPHPCWLTYNPIPRHLLLFAASTHTEFRPNTFLSLPLHRGLCTSRDPYLLTWHWSLQGSGSQVQYWIQAPWHPGASTALLSLVFRCAAAAPSLRYPPLRQTSHSQRALGWRRTASPPGKVHQIWESLWDPKQEIDAETPLQETDPETTCNWVLLKLKVANEGVVARMYSSGDRQRPEGSEEGAKQIFSHSEYQFH